MIGTTKGTHGMVITILNYDFYQNPKNYEGHNEGHDEIPTKGKRGAQYIQEGNKKDKNITHKVFQDWWIEKYKHKFQKDYMITDFGKFGGQVKALLKLPVSFEDLQYLAIEFFLDEDPFITGSEKNNGAGHNIGMFLTRINQNVYKSYLDADFRKNNKKHIVNKNGEPAHPEMETEG